MTLTPAAASALIAHINDDHLEQLLYCVRAFTPVSAATDARITALHEDGAEVEAVQGGVRSRQFIPLGGEADTLEGRFEALAVDAMKRLGVWPPRRVTTWTVTHNRVLSAHFRRLTFTLGGDARTDWQPGDSCRFDVAPGVMRPYTLRRVQGGVAEVDVYGHDGSPGTVWARGLTAGDEVTVRGERHEIYPDWTRGRAALLGDETALLAIAALLEHWTAPEGPAVLLELADAADRAYLDGVPLPGGTAVTWLNRHGAAGAALRAAANDLPFTPGAVWAAAEVQAATALRHDLKRRWPDADVKAIGYWRAAP